jgi:hypothetical protein
MPGHVDVGDKDFDTAIRRELLESLLGASRGHNRAAKVFQHRRGNVEHKRLVIDHKDYAGHQSCS